MLKEASEETTKLNFEKCDLNILIEEVRFNLSAALESINAK